MDDFQKIELNHEHEIQKKPAWRGRFWFLLAALASGWLGFQSLKGDHPAWWPGIFWQTLSFLLLWFSAPPRVSRVFPDADAFKDTQAQLSGGPSERQMLLVVIAVLTACAQCIWLQGRFFGGVFFLAAVFVYLLFRSRLCEVGFSLARSGSRDSFYILILVSIAAFARFPFAEKNWIGFQIDEANHLLDSIGFLEGRWQTPFRTVWWGNPALPHFIVAGFFKVFGETLIVARSVSMLVSLFALWFFYRLCREFFNEHVSFAITLMYSFSWWYLFYSFSPFHNIFTVFFQIAAFWCLVKALKGGYRGAYLGLGVFSAAAVMTYLPGRMVPGMVAATFFLILIFGTKKKYFWDWRFFGLTVLAFLWAIGPFLDFAIRHFDTEIMGRTKELSIFRAIEHTKDQSLLWKSFCWSFFSFFFPNNSVDSRFGIPGVPLLSPVISIFMLWGLMLSILSPGNFLSQIILPGFFFGLCADAFAVQGLDANPTYVNPMRYFLISPFLFLMAARAMHWVWGVVKESEKGFRRIARVFFFGLILFSLGWDSRVFYKRFPESPGWPVLGKSHLLVAQVILTHAKSHKIFVYWENFQSPGQFLTYRKAQVTTVTKDYPLPVSVDADRDVLFVMEAWAVPELQKRIQEVYPEARREVYDIQETPAVVAYFISKEAIRRHSGKPAAGKPQSF